MNWYKKQTGFPLDTHITKELIEKYLQGNCNPQEKAQVEAYIQKSGDLSILDSVLENEWANTDGAPSADIDTETSLQKFKAKRQQLYLTGDTTKRAVRFYLHRYKLLWITALVLIIISVLLLGYIK
ncbi:hypothetical protein QNI19_34465 [Cytophagaceae bacterium DM2B3-1]|uniref:Uncharacterized protein n=1 Tax=Xanthocytophaga flava TaxID=3048013 RepID=A0ABT7CWK3_9BACT|nr:hypothetical protein [Xanthocytophaga flavus]MDJ1498098.1 hypothetical protein [Xanthocytophaga flavus]